MKVQAFNMVFPLITAFCGMIIQFILSKKTQKIEHEYRVSDELNKEILKAYQKLYSETVKYRRYFELFIHEGNEYVDSEDPEIFAPMAITNNLINFFLEEEIFYSQKTTEKFWKMIDSAFILNSLANSVNSGFLIESVCPSCNHVVDIIKDFQNHIKNEAGYKNKR